MTGPTKAYPPLGVAVDIVLFTVVKSHLEVLLSRRDKAPFEGRLSLPGGFVGPNESADEAAVRELQLKAGVSEVFLEQLYTFSHPGRDPRSRVVSVAYYALVSEERGKQAGGSRSFDWYAVRMENGAAPVVSAASADPLAFDHRAIIATAIQRIRGKLDYVPIGYQLLPSEFTLTELQSVYEAVLEQRIDKRNFRAKVQRLGQLEALESFRTGSHRPARLYRFRGKVF